MSPIVKTTTFLSTDLQMFRKPCLKRPTEIPRYQVLQHRRVISMYLYGSAHWFITKGSEPPVDAFSITTRLQTSYWGCIDQRQKMQGRSVTSNNRPAYGPAATGNSKFTSPLSPDPYIMHRSTREGVVSIQGQCN